MRLIFSMVVALLLACKSGGNSSGSNEVLRDTIFLPSDPIHDTIYLMDIKKSDSLKRVNDALAHRLLATELTLNQARYYVKITIKNPSQTKFLKGWLRRVLDL
ncbi:hypothetical protein LL912_00940 [Niabella sp. CC-SYL272]|uniref:putative peptidoglycan-binding domain-containing protein n=1 Tax=Niabella agricola TaxID=2891571 RepID=UPI001F48FABB|nr:putative peptidoglycan-binding domain-containing protein [Niabella agricola]MCF3107333.1 hypothetical protein [Niabella agricola]